MIGACMASNVREDATKEVNSCTLKECSMRFLGLGCSFSKEFDNWSKQKGFWFFFQIRERRNVERWKERKEM